MSVCPLRDVATWLEIQVRGLTVEWSGRGRIVLFAAEKEGQQKGVGWCNRVFR